MTSESTLLHLVGSIYDAAADASRWPDFLMRFQAVLSSRNTALMYATPNEVVVQATGADQADIRKYHQYPCPWLDRLVAANWQTGGADASHHLIDDRELRKTECFSEFLGPRQFHYGLGAAIAAGNEPAVFVTLREAAKGPYSDDDLAVLRTLLPHMSRAFQLYGRVAALESDRRALASALDRLGTGLVLLDEASRILFTQ